MAFDFLGTFKEEDVKHLLEFAENQLNDVQDRINFFRSKIQRLGWIDYTTNANGDRVGFSITPARSELAKQVRAYHYHGGSVLDLNITSRGQWFFYTKGSADEDDFTQFQGGQVEGMDHNLPPHEGHFDDTIPSITTSKVKDWIRDPIQDKLERFEYKIRRTIDLEDQYLEETLLLAKRAQGAETLEDLKSDIQHYIESEDHHSAGYDE